MMAETGAHRTLKELAAIWLRGHRCDRIAFEVYLYSWELHINRPKDANEPIPQSYTGYRHYADVVGISKVYRGREVLPGENLARVVYEPRITAIEVKVSKSDLNHGFVDLGAHFVYVLTPPDLVDESTLPRPVGLLELDPSSYRVVNWNNPSPSPTVNLVIRKKATKQDLDAGYVDLAMKAVADCATNSLISALLDKYKSSVRPN